MTITPTQNTSDSFVAVGEERFNDCVSVRKHSAMGILSFVLSLTIVLSPIGLVLAIIDLAMNKDRRHGLTIAALIVGGVMTFFLAFAFISPSSSSSTSNNTGSNSGRVSSEAIGIPALTRNVIGIGDEFANSTIKGVVVSADLDYEDYNDFWTTLDEEYKAIYITIKVTNISKKDNYVSVSDFDCYVDNVIVSAELVTGGNEDYNANIAPGRSAILGALYVVPEDAKSIELEYNPIGEVSKRVIIKIT